MKPLVMFGDARAAAVGVLRGGLAGRGEEFAARVTVGTRVPGDRSPDRPRLPFLLVAEDGSPLVTYPVLARVTLRVTAWHVDDDQAHDLAQLAHGLLLVHSGPVLRSVRPRTGVLRTVDPATGIDLATCTVAANVRPVAVGAPTP